jgi:hypothetical protein
LLKQTNHALSDAIDLLIREYTHGPEFLWIISHNTHNELADTIAKEGLGLAHNELADTLAKEARFMAKVDISPDLFPRDSIYHNYLHIHNKLTFITTTFISTTN